VAAVALVLYLAWPAVRHALVERFSPAYVPEAARDFTPVFDGKDAGRPTIRILLRRVATDLFQPTDVAFVPGQPDLMVVLEKPGKMRLFELREGGHDRTVLEIRVLVVNEQGLLGIAFHPKFEENGRFFLDATIADGQKEITRVSEWTAEPGTLSNPRMARVILDVEQPYQNHNGGQLAFGPDGFLYIGLGDGGWMADPHDHGQDGSTMLGSMLRIDVDASEDGKAYAVPKDNPFLGRDGVLPETFAIGLRNPWRYSFLPDGRLIAADVGQDLYEEVTIVPPGGNLGWNILEGAHCFQSDSCERRGMTDPIHEYGRDEGGSVTGGYVSLAESFPALRGKYVFGDFLSGRLWALDVETREVHALGKVPILISTFGRDAAGRVYVADFAGGTIYRIDPEETP
jgi:glucose/arabinose dehydrogenase